MPVRIPLDATDEAILEALNLDGRRSYRDVARTVGVSEGTVRSRVRKLEQLGALRFVAFVDPVQLGKSALGMMLVRTEGSRQQAVVDEVVAWRETSYVSTLTGKADLYVQAMCADNEAYGELVNRVRAIPGVLEVETMLEYRVFKFDYGHPGAAR